MMISFARRDVLANVSRRVHHNSHYVVRISRPRREWNGTFASSPPSVATGEGISLRPARAGGPRLAVDAAHSRRSRRNTNVCVLQVEAAIEVEVDPVKGKGVDLGK